MSEERCAQLSKAGKTLWKSEISPFLKEWWPYYYLNYWTKGVSDINEEIVTYAYSYDELVDFTLECMNKDSANKKDIRIMKRVILSIRGFQVEQSKVGFAEMPTKWLCGVNTYDNLTDIRMQRRKRKLDLISKKRRKQQRLKQMHKDGGGYCLPYSHHHQRYDWKPYPHSKGHSYCHSYPYYPTHTTTAMMRHDHMVVPNPKVQQPLDQFEHRKLQKKYHDKMDDDYILARIDEKKAEEEEEDEIIHDELMSSLDEEDDELMVGKDRSKMMKKKKKKMGSSRRIPRKKKRVMSIDEREEEEEKEESKEMMIKLDPGMYQFRDDDWIFQRRLDTINISDDDSGVEEESDCFISLFCSELLTEHSRFKCHKCNESFCGKHIRNDPPFLCQNCSSKWRCGISECDVSLDKGPVHKCNECHQEYCLKHSHQCASCSRQICVNCWASLNTSECDACFLTFVALQQLRTVLRRY